MLDPGGAYCQLMKPVRSDRTYGNCNALLLTDQI